MPERLGLSRTLWLIVAPPAIAFVWQLATGRLRPDRGGSDPWPRRVGLGSVVVASGATLGQALWLSRAAGVDALVQRSGAPAHAGPLDAGFGLLFDRLAASACGLECVVAIAAATFLASRTAAERRGRMWAWLELALAGGLLSFLSDGFVTVFLGWTLTAAAAAWLEGWTDPRAGALGATRGALAILALLFGAASLAGPATGSASLALVAFAVAVAAMSGSTRPAGAPLALVALGSGGTTGLVGPFLLLRLAAPGSNLSGSGAAVAVAGPTLVIAGIAMIAAVGRRAIHAPAGPSRWLDLAGGAPAGLTCIALGSDGEKGGLLVLIAAGLTAALLLLAAAMLGARGVPARPSTPSARTDIEAALLVRAPENLGGLLLSFDRWVVDAIGGAVVVLAHAFAWALSRMDARRP